MVHKNSPPSKTMRIVHRHTYHRFGDILDGGGGRIALETKLTHKPRQGELGHIQTEVIVVISVIGEKKGRERGERMWEREGRRVEEKREEWAKKEQKKREGGKGGEIKSKERENKGGGNKRRRRKKARDGGKRERGRRDTPGSKPMHH